MKAPPNKRGIKTVTIDSKPFVVLSNPVHGPITADEAMQDAAHLAAAAIQAGSTKKLGDMIKAIQKEQGQ